MGHDTWKHLYRTMRIWDSLIHFFSVCTVTRMTEILKNVAVKRRGTRRYIARHDWWRHCNRLGLFLANHDKQIFYFALYMADVIRNFPDCHGVRKSINSITCGYCCEVVLFKWCCSNPWGCDRWNLSFLLSPPRSASAWWYGLLMHFLQIL